MDNSTLTAIGFISALTVATALVAWRLVKPRPGPERIVLDATPDRPLAFGPGMIWIAVRARSPEQVCTALELEKTEPANWRSGLACVHDPALESGRVFVSPSVLGWVFIVGPALPTPPLTPRFEDVCSPLMATLGREFTDCQYFAAMPDVDLMAWLRWRNGAKVRAFAVSEAGQVWNDGAQDRYERRLGLKNFDVRGLAARQGDLGGRLLMVPSAEQVFALAGEWGLDPTRIDKLESVSPACGIVAPAPLAWRPRMRNRATASRKAAA